MDRTAQEFDWGVIAMGWVGAALYILQPHHHMVGVRHRSEVDYIKKTENLKVHALRPGSLRRNF
jgi:hypothetical protein